MAKTVIPTVYRHSDHADWGPGLILEENATKLYLHFVDGGRRVFQNVPKCRDRLVPAGLPADEAADVIAVITKGTARVAAKKIAASKKKKKSKLIGKSSEPEVLEAVAEPEAEPEVEAEPERDADADEESEDEDTSEE